MTSPQTPTTDAPRRPLRPLHGIPEPEKRDRTGLVVSGLFHAAILLALLLPTLVARQLFEPESQGAGGPGPTGGGGGGRRGTGGAFDPEQLRFLQLLQQPLATEPRATPIQAPPPPPPVPPTETKPEVPLAPAADAAAPAAPNIVTPGSGGGSGNDGTGGNGPGRGGGIGTGEGTGRGSGIGPGTGGGGQLIYPPTVTNLAILPIPVPSRVRPYRMVAIFEVDERGNARLLSFNPSRDSGYNRKIREMLAEIRFRPATRADGTPVRDTTWITAEAPQ